MDRKTEQAAAQALLDRGIAFRIPAPLLWRLFGKKTMRISVKQLRLGTLVYLSYFNDLNAYERVQEIGDFRLSLIKEMGFEPISVAVNAIVENRKKISRSIACMLLNHPIKIRLFSAMMARILERRCTAEQLQELTMWLMVYSRVESFLNTTKLLGTMTLTKPMNCCAN